MFSIKISRRQFLKWLSTSAVALGLSQTDILKMEKALEAAVTDPNCTPGFPSTFARVIWITGADCGGCPTSLLNYLANPNDPDPVLNAIANNALGLPIPDIEALTPQGGDGHIDIAEVVTEVITIDWHYIVQAAAGDLANTHMATLRNSGDPYVLAIDGAIQTGNNGTFCQVFDIPGTHATPADSWWNYVTVYPDPNGPGNRTEFTMAGATLWLADNPSCAAVVAHGTCASFGGVPAAYSRVGQFPYVMPGQAPATPDPLHNETGARSAWEWINFMNGLNKTIVNVPGCPPNPDWLIHTVGAFLLSLLNLDVLPDHKGRPRLTSTAIYHDMNYVFCQDCPRRGPSGGPGTTTPQICQAARSVHPPDGLCLQQVGCNGWLAGPPHIRPDCPTRMWNKFEDMSNNNWCVRNNMPCQGCASPGFPDECSPFYLPNHGFPTNY